MELASMLAGEPFTDRPRSVCPVIGAFMRIYNDRLDGEHRQDLYAYASAVVGTSGAGAEATIARARACEDFAERMARRRPRPVRLLARRRRRQSPTPSAAGVAAARSLPRIDDEVHAMALAHIDLLISLGGEDVAAGRCDARPLVYAVATDRADTTRRWRSAQINSRAGIT